MLCEMCKGTGRKWLRDHLGITWITFLPCDNPLCHAGQVADYDGLQEQPGEMCDGD